MQLSNELCCLQQLGAFTEKCATLNSSPKPKLIHTGPPLSTMVHNALTLRDWSLQSAAPWWVTYKTSPAVDATLDDAPFPPNGPSIQFETSRRDNGLLPGEAA